MADSKQSKAAPDEVPKGTVKGKATYLIKADHYRAGVGLIPSGSVVTVEDEVPSKTWKRVASNTKGAQLLQKPVPAPVDDFDETEDEFPGLVDPSGQEVGSPVPNPAGQVATDKKKPNDKSI